MFTEGFRVLSQRILEDLLGRLLLSSPLSPLSPLLLYELTGAKANKGVDYACWVSAYIRLWHGSK